jgi:membrane-bound lytic murein transglycosylase D
MISSGGTDTMKKRVNANSFSLETNSSSPGIIGWKLSKALLAGFLVSMVISCGSVSHIDKGSYMRPAEKAGTTDAAKDKADNQDNASFVFGKDRKAGITELSDGSQRKTRTPGASTVGQNGNEDNTPFRDLPEIKIDERALTKKTIVGHDALIEKELKRLLEEFGDDSGKVETVFLNEVKLYVKAFQTNDQYRRFMTNSLRRSARYMPAVKEAFKRRNIPEDMSYIAFLESGFNPRARSHAGAVGMWQFMPGTAKQYSLRVSNKVDERLDPMKSTYAAVEYFHDLIAIFGPRSFLLALAAYNCGEGRIIGCLKKINNPLEERNFWHIRSCLARETREYPPKIIASAVIGSNPEVFGFPKFDSDGESREIQTAFAGFKSLEDVTPDVRPAPEQPARKGKGAAVKTASAGAPAKTAKPAKVPAQKPIVYVVKKNNTLPGVADIFGVEKEDIKKWNKMKSNHLAAGQKLKIYTSARIELVSYKVKKGDTITEICQSFKVRPASLIAANGLKNGWNIQAGQHLAVYKPVTRKSTIYTVRKGDSLKTIANKFGVSSKDIMRWNSMEQSQLRPKQQLKIYIPS